MNCSLITIEDEKHAKPSHARQPTTRTEPKANKENKDTKEAKDAKEHKEKETKKVTRHEPEKKVEKPADRKPFGRKETKEEEKKDDKKGKGKLIEIVCKHIRC